MNIENVENNSNQSQSPQTNIGLENLARTLKKAEGAVFELDFPEEEPTEKEDKTQAQAEAANASFVAYNDALFKQNLVNLAIKDKFALKGKQTESIDSLLMSNMFKFGKNRFKIDKMNADDEKFLKMLSSKTEMVIDKMNTQSNSAEIKAQTQDGMGVGYKSFDFSKGLFNLIEYAHTSKKPVRLDFDGNSSVILKVDKQGQLSAEFLSSDKIMETALKNSIPQLKNKLDNDGIPYKDIFYRDRNKDNNKNRDKGE